MGAPFLYTNIVGALGVFCVMGSLKNPRRKDTEKEKVPSLFFQKVTALHDCSWINRKGERGFICEESLHNPPTVCFSSLSIQS